MLSYFKESTESGVLKKSVIISIAGLITSVLANFAWANGVTARIVNGEVASSGDIPWQVAILHDLSDPFNSQSCGGTILNEEWVLTAAHCYGPDAPVTYVAAGMTNLNQIPSEALTSEVTWIVHEGYSPESSDNDIALLRLKTPFDLSACPNCMAIDPVTSRNESEAMPEGTYGVVSGWGSLVAGLDPENVYSPDLMYAGVYIISCTASPALYSPEVITNNMICGGAPDFSRDACLGDSGGPLVVAGPDGASVLLAGLVSWGNGCAVQGYPNIYTRVANYENWIKSKMNSDCCDQGTDSRFADNNGNNFTATSSSSGGGGSFSTLIVMLIGSLLVLRSRLMKRCRR